MAAARPSITRWPSSLGPAPADRRTGGEPRTPSNARSTRVDTPAPVGPAPLRLQRSRSSSGSAPSPAAQVELAHRSRCRTSDHVGGVDDGALARVVDDRVLHIERMRGDDALDQVLFASAVQRETEAAREDGAAFGDERRERVVDVLLAGEAVVTGGRKAACGKAVDRAGP